MYLVVSHWQALPGFEEQFMEAGHTMRKLLLSQPGVELVAAFESSGKVVVVHGYKDETTYNAIVSDPNGPFVRGAEETKIEIYSRWLGSEKGSTQPYD